jgi:hypothetical protein
MRDGGNGEVGNNGLARPGATAGRTWKRNGGFAAQQAAKIAEREGAKNEKAGGWNGKWIKQKMQSRAWLKRVPEI